MNPLLAAFEAGGEKFDTVSNFDEALRQSSLDEGAWLTRTRLKSLLSRNIKKLPFKKLVKLRADLNTFYWMYKSEDFESMAKGGFLVKVSGVGVGPGSAAQKSPELYANLRTAMKEVNAALKRKGKLGEALLLKLGQIVLRKSSYGALKPKIFKVREILPDGRIVSQDPDSGATMDDYSYSHQLAPATKKDVRDRIKWLGELLADTPKRQRKRYKGIQNEIVGLRKWVKLAESVHDYDLEVLRDAGIDVDSLAGLLGDDANFASQPDTLEPVKDDSKYVDTAKKKRDDEEEEDEDPDAPPPAKYPFDIATVQAYYDLQIGQGKDNIEAVIATREKFKIKDLKVNPVGEIQPVDGLKKKKPPLPPPLPPEEGGEDEEPEDEEGDEEGGEGDEEGAKAGAPPAGSTTKKKSPKKKKGDDEDEEDEEE